jgi:hypothetical protein
MWQPSLEGSRLSRQPRLILLVVGRHKCYAVGYIGLVWVLMLSVGLKAARDDTSEAPAAANRFRTPKYAGRIGGTTPIELSPKVPAQCEDREGWAVFAEPLLRDAQDKSQDLEELAKSADQGNHTQTLSRSSKACTILSALDPNPTCSGSSRDIWVL